MSFGSVGALIARGHGVGVGGNLSWDYALTRANALRERGVPKRS
jgi:hypothetical protein